jgi:PKD repeat protein
MRTKGKSVCFIGAKAFLLSSMLLIQGALAWTGSDVGGPALAGSYTGGSGTFTVNGAGADIWNTSDQIYFVYEKVSGDGQIIARVASQQNTNAWSKVGVMIRNTLTGGSMTALTAMTPSNGAVFNSRTADGAAMVQAQATGIAAPYWVRLTKSGTTISSHRSTDGTTWTLLGTATIPLSAQFYVGLEVCSHDVAKICVANFTNVSHTFSSTPQAPNITVSADRTSGAPPLTVSFNAANSGGTADTWSWTFGDGQTVPVQNPTHVYSAAGVYTATCVATNGAGSSTKSIIITVTTTPQPPNITISADRTIGAPPLPVQFTATNSGGTVITWAWTFGDGTTSAIQSPSHTYTSIGVYTATCVATNASGNSTKTVTITVAISPAQWQTNGNNIYYTAGNVGIGTNAPVNMLSVVNTGSGSQAIFGQGKATGLNYITLGQVDNYTGSAVNIGFDQLNRYAFLAIAGNPVATGLIMDQYGKVGIGTSIPSELLEVNGAIKARAIKINDWSLEAPDYVFSKEYKLHSLPEVEKYIAENNHLPEVASAQEMKENGVDLVKMNMDLLKKVEELTLYAIEQNKRIKALEKNNENK